MAEEVGIVISLYDKVSPTLKSLAGNTKAFDKSLDELEQSLKTYDKVQGSMVKRTAELKKALAEADQQVKNAQKSYRKLNDEASKKDLDQAINRQTELKRALSDTEVGLKANSKAYADLYEKARKAAKGMDETAAAASRAENRAGSGGTGLESKAKGLAKSGIGKLFGDALGDAGNVLLSSAMGESDASIASSLLAGAVSGGTMGAALGPMGIAAGAVVGGLAGLISGGSEVYAARDDAFKSYVQEAAQGQLEQMSSSIASGSATAAQRELDAIAFNRLLGEGAGDAYLADLRAMAASTPMEYSDLINISKTLATGFGGDTERMLALMEGIGNAGSAVGADASGMTAMARAMSQLQSSGKASLEYLNTFQERGIDVIDMLAQALGTDQSEIYDMISDGAISGNQAVNIIQQGLEQYSGAMDQMSQTYSGLESTLAAAQAEMDNAYGEGYNETRKQGLQEEIDYLNGESGAQIQEANRALGAWQAELENTKERYEREALDAVMTGAKATSLSAEAQARLDALSSEYQMAEGEGNAAEQGRLLAEARVLAQGEYNASEGAQLMVAYETELAANIRNDSASNDAYWDAGYRKGQEYSKGRAAGLRAATIWDVWTEDEEAGASAGGNGLPGSDLPFNGPFATGLYRVPYNRFPALLDEGERVLTASQARELERGGAGSGVIQVNLNGSWSVRSPEDVDEIAETIVRRLELAVKAGVNG